MGSAHVYTICIVWADGQRRGRTYILQHTLRAALILARGVRCRRVTCRRVTLAADFIARELHCILLAGYISRRVDTLHTPLTHGCVVGLVVALVIGMFPLSWMLAAVALQRVSFPRLSASLLHRQHIVITTHSAQLLPPRSFALALLPFVLPTPAPPPTTPPALPARRFPPARSPSPAHPHTTQISPRSTHLPVPAARPSLIRAIDACAAGQETNQNKGGGCGGSCCCSLKRSSVRQQQPSTEHRH